MVPNVGHILYLYDEGIIFSSKFRLKRGLSRIGRVVGVPGSYWYPAHCDSECSRPM